MAEHNAEYLKFKVVNNAGDAKEENRDFRILTIDKIHRWIEKKGYDSAVNIELKKMLSKYPHNAFAAFGKNFEKHLGEARRLAAKNRPMFVGELGDENYRRVENVGEEPVAPRPTGKVNSLPKASTAPNDFDEEFDDVNLSSAKSGEMPKPSVAETKIPMAIREPEAADKAPKNSSQAQDGDIPYGIRDLDSL